MYMPGNMTINDNGYLAIGELDLVKLAEQYGTPLYVYDEALIRKRCREYREALKRHYPQGEAIFAGKAFLTLAMCRLLMQEGLGLDVVSEGELYTAARAGFPMEQVYFHGNNKSPAELKMAVELGVGRIVVDSLMELELLGQEASRQRKTVRILLRVRPGISADTHRHIQTGQEDSKFGLGISDGQALTAAKKALKAPRLKLMGLHCHIGSQIIDLRPFQLAAEIMMDLREEIRLKTGTLLLELDLGGGLGIRYTAGDNPAGVTDLVLLLAEAIKGKAKQHCCPLPRLLLEPGRSIVGEAGVTLYTVGTIKEVPGIRRYVSVDGGMSDNLRCALYGARYEAVLANRPQEPAEELVTVAGKACESGDILIYDIKLPSPRPGDILAVLSTGAYHFSMYSQYNRHPRPAVVFVNGGQAELVVRREPLEELTRLELIPSHLEKVPDFKTAKQLGGSA